MSEFSPELTRAIEDYELRVSPDLKTVSGRLKYGISVDGAVHRDFSMHLLTVREDMAIDPTLEGQARMLAAYSASLDHIGTIQPDVLTPDFLADELVATDFDALYFAQELLAKKRLSAQPVPTATDTQS
ncbi:hypothetical protein [Neisseria lactamica]|uniref:hypothetical protein n=1 Tax=Neisseria lactamica TaxID=486 RepID=UPI000E572223|nr:hypothetical protein [Neisseria lactamica]